MGYTQGGWEKVGKEGRLVNVDRLLEKWCRGRQGGLVAQKLSTRRRHGSAATQILNLTDCRVRISTSFCHVPRMFSSAMSPALHPP